MSNTRKLFESFQNNLNEAKKYNIYVTYGGDGVYNSKLVDTVDSQEQAIDKVAELQATGVGASYEEVNESIEFRNNLTESIQKDESLDDDFLNYLLSELEIDRYGEITYIPDFEDAETYKDLTEEEYNKSVEYIKNLIGNAKFYRDNGKLYIELNDNHTFWDIDNENLENELDYIGDYLKPYFDAFEADTGVELWQAGRSGRHIIVEYNLENLERYDELKTEQEIQEKAFIEEMNNIGKEDIEESDSNENNKKYTVTYTKVDNYDKAYYESKTFNNKEDAEKFSKSLKDNRKYLYRDIKIKEKSLKEADYLDELNNLNEEDNKWSIKDDLKVIDILKIDDPHSTCTGKFSDGTYFISNDDAIGIFDADPKVIYGFTNETDYNIYDYDNEEAIDNQNKFDNEHLIAAYDIDDSEYDKLNNIIYLNELNETEKINDMSIEEMIKEYADMCDNAGLDTKEVLQNLLTYNCLQTGSFRNMLEELNEYLES